MDEAMNNGGLQQWLKKQWDCLFMDETHRLLSNRLKRRPKEVERHIDMLKSIMKNEEDYFWRDVCRPNLLAYLCLLPPASKWTESSELIQRSLRKEATSVAALLNQLHVLKLEKKDEQADEVLDRLNDLDSRADSNVLRLVAKAEVAYCLEYIGPDFYLESIRKYENVLDEIDSLTDREREHEMIQSKLCSWKFQLAQAYTRLTTRGKTEQFSGEYEIDSAFRKCSKLLTEVIDSRDHFYHGRALVELVELYKKNEFSGMVDSVEFPYKEGPRHCIDEAYKISQDPYVLERCGRYYRQISSKEEEYVFAIKALRKAIDIGPTRHMAWHQMSLAYKHLSALSVKADKISNSKQPARNYRQHDLSRGGYSPAKRSEKASTVGSTNKTTRSAVDSNTHRNTSDRQQRLTFSEKTINCCDQALACLEKATKLMDNTSCRYLVDLAKCHVFCKRFPEAETYFQLAANTEECANNDNDAAYLYEHWADKWDRCKDAAVSLEDIKSMYREAIKRSIRGNLTCGRLAFFNLRRILRAELMITDDDVLELEVSLLLSDDQSSHQEGSILVALLDALRNDPAKVDTAWKLIKLYHTRSSQYDASAAYTYLTALDRAGQLRLDEEGIEDTVIRRKMIIDLVTRAADESDIGVIAKLRGTARLRNSDETTNVGWSQLGNVFPQQDLRHAFRWLVGGKTFSERGFRSNNDGSIDGKYDTTDLCLLAWDDVRKAERTTVSRLRKLLEDWCALGDGVYCFPDDTCSGHSFSQAAAAMLSKTKAVAVILGKGLKETDTKSDLDGSLANVLRSLNSQLDLRSNICFVVEDGFQLEGFSQYDWPRFQASSNLSDACIISSFFEVLFLNSTKV